MESRESKLSHPRWDCNRNGLAALPPAGPQVGSPILLRMRFPA